MRLSLPFRMFLVHLAFAVVFTLGAGYWVVREVDRTFDDYASRWRSTVETFGEEKFYAPLAHEVARSLLTATRDAEAPEVLDRRRQRVSDGIRAILRAQPRIRGLFIVDRDLRIQYASDSEYLDLLLGRQNFRTIFASRLPVRRVVEDAEGSRTELMIPVFTDAEVDSTAGLGGSAGEERIGSVLVFFDGTDATLPPIPDVEVPSVESVDITLPVVLLVVGLACGSLLVALITARPVRRLEAAVEEFRARRFRGRLQVQGLGERGELAATVRAINELGGELEALDRRGREREVLFATLSRALEDGMIAVGPDGSAKAWNPAALRILGIRTPPESDGASIDDASGGTARPGGGEPDVVGQAISDHPDVAAAIMAGEDRVEVREVVGLADDGDGGAARARLTSIPFEVVPGERGRLLLLRDLETLHRIESQILESSRYAVLAHLAAGLAHEIRNPLHSIGINAQVVEAYVERERDERTVEAMRESLTSIRDETRRLTGLLNNYLGLVRPAEGSGTVDIVDLCRRVIQLLEYTAGLSGVTLALSSKGSLPTVHGVADRLQQAILNLVLNAIQAMPDGGSIRLEVRPDGGHVRVDVVDTGPGVPAEIRDRLFSIRVTTKPGGTGLGLPLVRLIAESHGGSVAFEPNGDRGSRFILRIPSRKAA